MTTLNDEFASLEPGEKVQAAYDESGEEHSFAEVVLHPWTAARHGVAIQMGSSVIQAIGPHVKSFLSGGSYPNRYRDVVIVLWLSSLEREEVQNLCALPAPEFRVIDAYEWFEKAGGKFGSKLFFDGAALVDEIVRDILASFFSIEGAEPQDEEDKKKVIDLPGKSNSSLEPSRPAATTPTTSTTTCPSPESYNGEPCGLPADGKPQPNWFSRLIFAINKIWQSWQRSLTAKGSSIGKI